MDIRKISIYAGVVLLLSAALIGGVIWVKNRSQQVASKQPTIVQQDTGKKSDTNTNSATPDAQKPTAEPSPVVTTPAASTPAASHVPATGPTSTGASFFGVMILVFSAAVYLQTRRRLQSIR